MERGASVEMMKRERVRERENERMRGGRKRERCSEE
jgi:hypothetical protein